MSCLQVFTGAAQLQATRWRTPNAAQIQGGQLVASVKALGGGWDAHSLADISVKPSLKAAFLP
jgi:hypothetical protein